MPAPPLDQLVAPAHTALILQEVQENVIGPDAALDQLAAAAAEVGVVERLRELTARARRVGVPVLHCTADGLPGGFGSNRNARLFGGARRRGIDGSGPARPEVRIPEGVLDASHDIVLPRYQGLSPLTGTQLDPLLRNAGVTTVVVTGVSLNVAIPNLVFDAVNRSYQVVLVGDAVAGVPVEYGRDVVRHALSLLATVVTAEQLGAVWEAAAPA